MEVYAEGAQIKHERRCGDCGGTEFVEDHAAGDIVCNVRGAVAPPSCCCCLPRLVARHLGHAAVPVCEQRITHVKLPSTCQHTQLQGACTHIVCGMLLYAAACWQNCGLVAEAHIIDERSEWRTFGDKVCCWGTIQSSCSPSPVVVHNQ